MSVMKHFPMSVYMLVCAFKSYNNFDATWAMCGVYQEAIDWNIALHNHILFWEALPISMKSQNMPIKYMILSKMWSHILEEKVLSQCWMEPMIWNHHQRNIKFAQSDVMEMLSKSQMAPSEMASMEWMVSFGNI